MELFKLFGSIVIDNDKANASIHKTEQQASSSSSKMSGIFKKLGAVVATAFTVQKVVEFGKACIDAYKIQEQAEVKLETIMKQRMGATDKSIQSVKDLTSAQQKLGVVGDEVQLSGAQQLSTFLTTDSALKTLIPAMNNLGVQQKGVNVTGQDMVNIGNLMGKAMQGQVGALTRVGITFNEAQEKVLKYGTEEERAAMLAQVITDNVGNMNEELAKTDEGKQQQLKNTLGDIQEVIGQRLIPIQNLWYQGLTIVATFVADTVLPVVDNAITYIHNLADGFMQNTDMMNVLKEAWTTYGQPVFDAIVSVFQTIYDSALVVWPAIQDLLVSVWTGIQDSWNTWLKPVFDFIVQIVLDIFNLFNQYWPMIAQIVSEAFTQIKIFWETILKPVFDFIGQVLTTVILPVFQTVWGGVKEVIGNCFDTIKDLWDNTLKPVFTGIVDFLQGVFTGDWEQAWNGVKSICEGVWEGIKTAIETPMENAKEFIHGCIETVKGFFNFTISWPHIPIPSFYIDPPGWTLGDLLDGIIPSLGITWNAKGGVMMDPTIFGFNPMTGNLLGGGEAGPEAIAPISVLQDYVREAVADSDVVNVLNAKFDKLFVILEKYMPSMLNQQLVLDTGVLVAETADKMDEQLGIIQKRRTVW